mmetsp:Transcript_44985/g.140928  ORF Transcript_44985/g.140928 Transcript_44985/m.140928 type:complete len:704 (-) Transcript_44985:169-2280(-)
MASPPQPSGSGEATTSGKSTRRYWVALGIGAVVLGLYVAGLFSGVREELDEDTLVDGPVGGGAPRAGRHTNSELGKAGERWLDFLRQKYESEGKSAAWGMRAAPLLYEKHGILLAASTALAPPSMEPALLGDDGKAELSFTIENVGSGGCDQLPAGDLEIWVRISGPETFTVEPVKDPSLCRWSVRTTVSTAGVYTVDMKLISYLGGTTEPAWDECHTETMVGYAPTALQLGANEGLDARHPALRHMYQDVAPTTKPSDGSLRELEGVKGYHYYFPDKACCELCTRVDGCTHWMSPGLRQGTKCSLFHSDAGEDEAPTTWTQGRLEKRGVEDDIRGKKYYVGRAQRQRTGRNFLGCGWSTALSEDHVCSKGGNDDEVIGSGFPWEVVSTKPLGAAAEGATHTEIGLRSLEQAYTQKGLCARDAAIPSGRWVELPEQTLDACQAYGPELQDMVNKDKTFIAAYHEGDGKCWLREHFPDIVRLKLGNELKQSLWTSDLFDKPLFAAEWRPNDCRLEVLERSDLQACVDRRGVRSVDVRGSSVSEFFGEFVKQRLTGTTAGIITPDDAALAVEIHDLRIPFMVIDLTLEEWRKQLEETVRDATPGVEYYWMPAPYFSSERAPLATAPRERAFNRIARSVLSEAGWMELDWYESSKALAFETYASRDGLHAVGPAMKALFEIFANKLCHPDAPDARVRRRQLRGNTR